MQLTTRLFLLLTSICFANAAAAAISPVFFDSFDAEPGAGDGASGQSKINYVAFLNWVVSDGSVDLIAQGDFGPIDCADGAGKCVDLDGTSNDGGVMTSVDIELSPQRYKLEMLLAGVSSNFTQAGSGSPNEVSITVDGILSTTAIRNQGDGFIRVVREFSIATPTTTHIVIENLGGDNLGAVLDNVSITPVPLPAAGWLILGGLLALVRGATTTARLRPAA